MDRAERLSLLVALPAVIAACWIAASRPSPAAPMPPAVDFAEALRQDLIEVGFVQIREGQDPDAPIPFQDERLTGGDELQVTPLLIAIAAGRTDSVMMLMSSGATLSAPGNRFARCLAERLHYNQIIDVLERDGGEPGATLTCPDAPHDDAAPLRAYAF